MHLDSDGIVDTWGISWFVIPILGSAHEHLEIAVVFRELFPSWWMNIYTLILHPKNWNKKKLEKIRCKLFSKVQLFKLISEGLAESK